MYGVDEKVLASALAAAPFILLGLTFLLGGLVLRRIERRVK